MASLLWSDCALQASQRIWTKSAWEKVDHQDHECQAKVSVLSQGEATITDIQSEDGEVSVVLGEITCIRPEKVLQARVSVGKLIQSCK